MQSQISSLIGNDKLVGAVTVLARQGEITHHQAYGLLDRETNRPMPLDAIFRIYSMTKPITSLAILLLVDQGKIALHNPVAHFLPGHASPTIYTADGEIPSPSLPTIDNILSHTAGYDYRIWETPVAALYRERGVWDVEKTLAETVDILAELPLLYAPGTSWQ